MFLVKLLLVLDLLSIHLAMHNSSQCKREREIDHGEREKRWVCSHGEAVKACSLMAEMTSLKRILEVSVWPWKMIGSPSSPSQQSTASGATDN